MWLYSLWKLYKKRDKLRENGGDKNTCNNIFEYYLPQQTPKFKNFNLIGDIIKNATSDYFHFENCTYGLDSLPENIKPANELFLYSVLNCSPETAKVFLPYTKVNL